MIPQYQLGDYAGWLRISQQTQAGHIEEALTQKEKLTSRIRKHSARKKALAIIRENKSLLTLAYPILSEKRIRELREEIHETVLSILDRHFNSFHELRELYNAIPWNMPETDHWIVHDIMLRLNTRENLDFHQMTAWKQFQQSSREFPLEFACRFWGIHITNIS